MSSRIFGPYAHVEHRHGLVGDEQDRVEDDRACDHRPLLLSAGEVGRVLVEELLGRRETYRLERLGDAPPTLRTLRDPVDLERMADGLLDRHRGIERGMRILEHDLHPAT